VCSSLAASLGSVASGLLYMDSYRFDEMSGRGRVSLFVPFRVRISAFGFLPSLMSASLSSIHACSR